MNSNLSEMKNKNLIPFILGLLLLVSSLQAQTIFLAYTANLNGTLESCHCQGNTLGGMVQLGSAVDSLRLEHPDLILVDSGDFLNSYTLPGANSLMWEFMSSLKYDAISPGDQEFVEGQDFIRKKSRQYPLQLVSCNIVDRQKAKAEFMPYRIIERNSLKIGIIGVVYSSAFDFIDEPGITIAPASEALEQTITDIKNKCDILVLLCHAGYEDGMKLAEDIPALDVIITGHTQRKESRMPGKQIVLQPGVDGEYIGFLQITKENGQIIYKNQFRPVNESLGKKEIFQKNVDQYYRKLKSGAF
ncbi:MAG: hypothetical protein P8184_12330 [Calditrichia bacterium]